MNENQKLRQDSLLLYEQDIGHISEILEELLRLSKGKCAMLIDLNGHLIAKLGGTTTFDDQTVSALVAGSFEATREMAKLLGEDEFSVIFHQGRRDSIQLGLVGDRAILAVTFDDQTTAGMVRLYAGEATTQLADIMQEVLKRKTTSKDTVPAELGESAHDKLEELFGGKTQAKKEGGKDESSD
jgi:predicted regulator of Ras-like GTPase activity (Roadblock/LC7/MglB family)